MDVKEKINEIVEKVKKDPKFMEEFKKDPVKESHKITYQQINRQVR